MSNKIWCPHFCFPFRLKNFLHTKSFPKFCFKRIFISIFKIELNGSAPNIVTAAQPFSNRIIEILFCGIECLTTLVELFSLDGGGTCQKCFSFFLDFRANRFRKTGCFHPGRIHGPRVAQRHLNHENRYSRSANSTGHYSYLLKILHSSSQDEVLRNFWVVLFSCLPGLEILVTYCQTCSILNAVTVQLHPRQTDTTSSSDAAIRKYFSNMEWLSIEKGTLINCDPYEIDVFFSVQREIYLKKT